MKRIEQLVLMTPENGNLKEIISGIQQRTQILFYAAPHYDKASISGIAKSDLELTVSDKVFLDFLLMKIRARTISYATMKKKKKHERKKTVC